jgi:hypothetical protein
MAGKKKYEINQSGRVVIGSALPIDVANKLCFEKILTKIEISDNGCWVWKGWVNPQWGYGFMSYRNKSWRLHCLMWTLTRGPIPKGMVIRHTCDNPPCCNPLHLEIGTHRDNVHDRMKRGRDHKSNVTHCPMGHEYAGEHLQLDKSGYRHCKTCSRIKQRIKSGWPMELAMSLPPQKPGYSPLRR